MQIPSLICSYDLKLFYDDDDLVFYIPRICVILRQKESENERLHAIKFHTVVL